jgi:biopolymer transport protein ExbB
MKPHFLILFALVSSATGEDINWWNPAWTQRQPLTLDLAAGGVPEDTGATTLLVRLSDSNFPFTTAREDGSDLRIIAADGKTQLAYQIESWDPLLHEAFIWVHVPSAEASGKQTFQLYSGNPTPDAPPKATDAFDSDTALVWHFAGRGVAPTDTTANNNSALAPATTAEGSLIGNGLRLLATPISFPESPSLEWKPDQTLTLATWIKPTALQENAVLLSRGEGPTLFQILLNQGVPTLKVGSLTSPAAAAIPAQSWSHLAVVADGKALKIFLNGDLYTTLAAALPASVSPITLGAATSGFSGEVDEFSISRIARSSAWIKASAVNQGTTDKASLLCSLGTVEGGIAVEQSHLMQHLSLFGDIAKNMMFDGWIAIGVCAIMIVVGWTVAVKKFIYLNSIEKGTKVFLGQWKSLSTDLTALDPGDKTNTSSLGGQVNSSDQGVIEKSPLYHIYQIGSEEIRHRLAKDGSRVQGLSGRSIQAIRASLDAGLVHESHRLSDGLVYLTISIAGGPYVGLLGTVVGVMITFAIIAKSGEVNVNSIAPGIASALLATVVGLVVAIPALFIYSYLNGRIKNSLGLMQVFIDEFVAKMAEFYRPPTETESPGSSSH